MRDRPTLAPRVPRRAEAEHASILRNCRTVYGTAAVLIVVFGAFHKAAVPEAIDPWSTRISLSAICGTLLFATSYVEWLKRHCTEVTAGLLCGLTAWFIIVTAVNDFSPAYGLGVVFTIAATGFALLMTQDGVRPVLFYATLSTLTVVLFVLVLEPPRAVSLITIGAVAGIGVIIVLSSRLRTHLVTSLEESEKRFRKLSEAAFEAIFITDDDIIVDCNTNALLLLGHNTRDRVLGCALSDFMRQSERTASHTERATDLPYRFESTMLRSDGTLVPVEIRGRSAGDSKHDIRVMAVRDISEQKNHERELIESRRRVEETLEIRNAILTNVSHEFRTPLAIMLGYAEMLKEEKFDDAVELGELIYESGKNLNDTLNLILELAQIEGGGFALSKEKTDVAGLVQDVVESHRRRASLKLLGLSFQAVGTDHMAWIDRVRVLKIIDYLIDNAIKFTDEGGIEIRVESDELWTQVVVQDTGVGIDEEFLPQVFEAFVQESSGLTRSHGGLGVGLTIARHMAQSMGGDITVTSRKGEGSTFVVMLPRTSDLQSLPAEKGRTPASPQGPEALEKEGSAGAVWL